MCRVIPVDGQVSVEVNDEDAIVTLCGADGDEFSICVEVVPALIEALRSASQT